MAPHLVQSIKNASRVRHVSEHAAHAQDVESARFLGRKIPHTGYSNMPQQFALHSTHTWPPHLVQIFKNASRVRHVSQHA
jgi:hypothetical protein